MRLLLIPAAVALLCCGTGCSHKGAESWRIGASQTAIPADGVTEVRLPLRTVSGRTPSLASASVRVSASPGHGEVRLDMAQPAIVYRAGVLPGEVELVFSAQGARPMRAHVTLRPVETDRLGDGVPDFLRLDAASDRQAFRRWFILLAERQALADARPPAEITDCAALLRYCYREALRRHDAVWAAGQGLGAVPVPPDVGRYQYPYTPLGPRIFRVREGAYRAGEAEAFAEFADAGTLLRLNTEKVGRDVGRARPGDLLFFRQGTGSEAYHSMIFAGAGSFGGGGQWLIYHTGPDGRWPGEIRRVTLDSLLHHPEPRWRPVASNPNFLGVYRWKILHEAE
jgi:hypothetical protein